MNDQVTILLIILSLEAISGLSIHVGTIYFICISYFKGQEMSPTNKIILALNISNVIYMYITFTSMIIYNLWSEIFTTGLITPLIFTIVMFCMTSSSWLTAVLCFFYFTKIKTFRSQFLSRLKTKIDAAVPWMILLAEVVSLLIASLNLLQYGNVRDPFQNTSSILSADINSTSNATPPPYLYVCFTGSFVPFLISVVTLYSTVRSLSLQNQRTEKNMAATSINIKTYSATISIMNHLLRFYGVFYAVFFYYYYTVFSAYSSWLWIFLVVMGSYFLSQSILLILLNPKLKDAWKETFHGRNRCKTWCKSANQDKI